MTASTPRTRETERAALLRALATLERVKPHLLDPDDRLRHDVALEALSGVRS